ncbi:MAG TPA: hypothetical protein G4O12_06525, partial [Dehalococcoidia bacterium]|nr:hypothetical protein [Dehalococcoidia bacterium]
MKTKYPSMLGALAILMLVASLVVPANLATPEPVDAEVCWWTTVGTPGVRGKRDVLRFSEIIDWAVNGNTMIAAVAENATPWVSFLRASFNGGMTWTGTRQTHLVATPGWQAGDDVYWMAMAPDDSMVWAVAVGNVTAGVPLNINKVFYTDNGGASFTTTAFQTAGAVGNISCIDISMDYGGVRDIAVGTRTGLAAGGGQVWVVKSSGFGTWTNQGLPAIIGGADVLDLKFSPTYVGDACIA